MTTVDITREPDIAPAAFWLFLPGWVRWLLRLPAPGEGQAFLRRRLDEPVTERRDREIRRREAEALLTAAWTGAVRR